MFAYICIAKRRNNATNDKNYSFNPLSSIPHDEEEGDELAYLNEFSISDEESDDSHNTDSNTYYDDEHKKDSVEYLSAGKKVRDLYSTSNATVTSSSKEGTSASLSTEDQIDDYDDDFVIDSDKETQQKESLIKK